MPDSKLILLPGSPGCIICDNNGSNPRSLHLKLFWNELDKAVHIPCIPDETWCGYSRIVHGGMIASVLDEGMAWAVYMTTGDWAFTADYSIRYRKAVAPGSQCLAIAKVLEDAGRKIMVEANFTTEDRTLLAKATATFLPAKGRAIPRAIE